MVADRPIQMLDEPLVLRRKPEGCLTFDRGALVSIRRAMLTGSALRGFRDAVDRASQLHSGGLVLLTAFRLDPRFPLQPNFDSDLGQLADTLRTLDRKVGAVASVLEFGGVRAAAMRVASRSVWAIARPTPAMADFDRVADAAQWLAQHGAKIGAPTEPADYVRGYRCAARQLAELDREARVGVS